MKDYFHEIIGLFIDRCADTPDGPALTSLYRRGDLLSIGSYPLSVDKYSNAWDYVRTSDVVSLVKKLKGLQPDSSLADAAFQKWEAAERECFRTNRYISDLRGYPENPTSQLLLRMSAIVSDILGPLPPITGRHGPGSTYSDRGVASTPLDKMSSVPTMTPDLWPILSDWSQTAWSRALRDTQVSGIDVVEGNRFTTVPKDSRTDRAIAIEPSINVFYQLGLGAAMRRRLKRVGIDLNNGQQTQRELARHASITGRLATIDLSSASDTVASELVRSVLPFPWLRVAEMLRSPKTLTPKGWVLLEKFSSMGNGFTFELETLIFVAICRAVASICGVNLYAGVNFGVYGDDIIVPTEIAQEVLVALELLGFQANREKTFIEGPFRESCGADFFAGNPVRGLYVKTSPSTPEEWIRLANGIRRLAYRDGGFVGDPLLLRAWHKCLQALPVRIRSCRGPEYLGDLVIHDDPSFWTVRERAGIKYVRCYRPLARLVTALDGFAPSVILAFALLGQRTVRQPCIGLFSRSDNRGWGIPSRHDIRGYKLGWVTC